MLIDWKKIPVAPGMRAGSDRQGICANKMSAVRVVTSPDAKFDGNTHRHDNEQILCHDLGHGAAHRGRAILSSSLPAHVMPPSAWEARARSATRSSHRPAPISFRAGSVNPFYGSTRYLSAGKKQQERNTG